MREFNHLCESYEVLSNHDLKERFDKHGHDGLKDVGTKIDGRFQTGYAYNGKCFDIFEKFFGNKSPFTDNFDHQHLPSTVNDPNDADAPKDIEVTLKCSIYEFYNGSLKTFDYKRNKLQPDERSIKEIEETMTIEVKPGDDCTTCLTFPSRGNEAFSYH